MAGGVEMMRTATLGRGNDKFEFRVNRHRQIAECSGLTAPSLEASRPLLAAKYGFKGAYHERQIPPYARESAVKSWRDIVRNRSVLLNPCSLECPELIYDAGELISHSTSCSAFASFKSDGFFEVYAVLYTD